MVKILDALFFPLTLSWRHRKLAFRMARLVIEMGVKTIALVISAITFMITMPIPLNAASFDCDEARTKVEKVICGDPQLSSLDEKMAASYKDLLASTDSKESVKEHQRSWLKSRSLYLDAQTLADMYMARIVELDDQSLLEWARIFTESKSASKRREALIKINTVEDFGMGFNQAGRDRHKFNRIGLSDPSPLVREMAVGYFRDDDQAQFVPPLIKAMATDVSPEVRLSAAFSLSSFYTDNGTDGTEDAGLVAQNIDLVLAALADRETQRPVAEILGARYSGVTPLPCRMPKEIRGRIVKSLQEAKKGAASDALKDLDDAIENTSSCK